MSKLSRKRPELAIARRGLDRRATTGGQFAQLARRTQVERDLRGEAGETDFHRGTHLPHDETDFGDLDHPKAVL
jgi:hypothetical protein